VFQIRYNHAWRTGRLNMFTEVSDEHISILKKFGHLETAKNVVELGCGVGRDAIPLANIVPEDGTYLGIDIMKPSIEWARANISAKHPNFDFAHFDIADAQHNPKGYGKTSSWAIPRPSESQDLIFLYSVFTHMFPADLSYYLGEFARILRPSGRVLASMFTMDRELIPYLESIGGGGLRNLTFAHEVEDGFFHNDPKVVPGATAYSLQRIEDMAKDAGLVVDRFARGSWRRDGNSDVKGQDIVVFKLR